MKKIIFISIIIICNSITIFAQTDYTAKEDSIEQTKTVKKPNLAFIELGENGIILSINYERYFTDNLSIRIGWGIHAFLNSTYIPILLNYTFEKSWELGIGIVTYDFDYGYRSDEIFASKENGVLITSVLGFKKKFNWMLLKVSFTPLYNPTNSKIQLYGGLSFGILF